MDVVISKESVKLSSAHMEDFTIVRLSTEGLESMFDNGEYSDNFIVLLEPGEVDTNNVLTISRAKRDVISTYHSAFGYLNQMFEGSTDLV